MTKWVALLALVLACSQGDEVCDRSVHRAERESAVPVPTIVLDHELVAAVFACNPGGGDGRLPRSKVWDKAVLCKRVGDEPVCKGAVSRSQSTFRRSDGGQIRVLSTAEIQRLGSSAQGTPVSSVSLWFVEADIVDVELTTGVLKKDSENAGYGSGVERYRVVRDGAAWRCADTASGILRR